VPLGVKQVSPAIAPVTAAPENRPVPAKRRPERAGAVLYPAPRVAYDTPLSRGGGPVVLYEIVDAVAHPDHTVTITWSDGVRGVVDFLPIIDRGGWFTPLRDPDWFTSTMILLPGGIGLTWPEEIDYSADGLRREAFPNGIP
jgi:hypothetical protein